MTLYDFSYLLPKENQLLGEDERGKYADKTFSLNLEKGGIDGMIEETQDVVTQSVFKILSTDQGAFPIYSQNYGIALDDLRGVDAPIAESEIKRRITAALCQDSRITEVKDFSFSDEEDVLRVSFSVITEKGTALMEWKVDNL